MLAIKHILFPVDFSERTCGAALFVNAMARRFHADVTLLNVANPIPYVGLEPPYPSAIYDDSELKADIQRRLEDALVKELADVPVQRIAEVGEPSAVITCFAQTRGIDLIMMPTHGYGPFRRFLLGSVTAKVLHDAECPVWTGAHMEQRPALGHVGCKAVLCAVDGTLRSGPVISWAADFAKRAGATLRLVHVVPAIEGWPERQFDREYEDNLRTKARTEIERILERLGIDTPLCVVAGSVAAAVRDEAGGHGADLLVIGRGAGHEGLGRLRMHAYGIIREAPCPVISV
jgi:nucleotide-binding universal stress UspA family protein